MSFTFYDEIMERKIELSPIHYQNRYDLSSRKLREIGVASIKQQVYDYIVVIACLEMFNSKIGLYQCASLPNRGCYYGKSKIEKWIRTNPTKTKYAFKCDIKKCYPSINTFKLKELLRRDIKNDDILYIIYTLIDTYKQGLSIGSYLSQYLANYYLSYAYHFIGEQLYKTKKKRRSNEVIRINLVTHHLFYMDDIIMFGSRKADLKMAAKKLEKYLNEELLLSLKEDRQLFPVDSRPIDMMGFKITRTHTTIRRRIFLKSRKLLIKYKGEKVNNMTLEDARSIISYYGYIKHSNSLKFRKKYKVDKTIEFAKGVASRESRIHRETTQV